MLKPGQKLLEYEIVRLLGQGGFATVYEARDRMLDRQVAIKQLRLDNVKSERAVKISIVIVKTFVKLREIISTHKELSHKLDQLDKKMQRSSSAVYNGARIIRKYVFHSTMFH